MKKLILAAIIALTAAACTKEDTTVVDNSNVTAVEFNISLADRASRAFAKAESVDCLHYNIFLAGGRRVLFSQEVSRLTPTESFTSRSTLPKV
ncbi:MAG: hypothetical protein IIU64_04075 [Alistipes sp.]|nr:hypothetical protein [Alistipes sp.]